ncbi:MAG: hypothetical protein ACW980_22835 [Promethearchaeota archaeon]
MESQNCWKYWHCQKEIRSHCPAYATGSGKECFTVAGDYCLKVKKDVNDCWECPFYESLLGEEGIYKLPS